MMSHNRLTFVFSFAVMAMAAVGLNVLSEGRIRRRWWFWLPGVVVAALSIWCTFRRRPAPEPLATSIERHRQAAYGIASLVQLRKAQWLFCRNYLVAGLLCVAALAAWLVLWSATKIPRWFVPALGVLLVADLLWFGYGRSPQCDRALYYPPLPVLEEVKAAAAKTPGRVIGDPCLPAVLAETQGLPQRPRL